MKIFITNRNYVTWPKALVEHLANQGHDITFIDNGSTYIPLLDYYSTCGFKVIRLSNAGAHAAWEANIVTGLTEHYVCGDSDYDISMVPDDWDQVLLEGLYQFPYINKFGFSWDESKVPQENPAYEMDEMYKYSDQNPRYPRFAGTWEHAANDSSFALQRAGSKDDISGIRKAYPYTAVHLPWHLTLEPAKDPTKRYELWTDEIAYYFLTCERSSCTWGRMLKHDVINQYLQLHNKTAEWVLKEYGLPN